MLQIENLEFSYHKKKAPIFNGISLTINDCGRDSLQVNVIPDTQKRTAMRHWRPGSAVNMETDVIGKYVRRLFQCGVVRDGGMAAPPVGGSPVINYDFLRQNGFL